MPFTDNVQLNSDKLVVRKVGWPPLICEHQIHSLWRAWFHVRFALLILRPIFRYLRYSLAGSAIENGIAKELFSCPRRRIAAQIFVEPFDVRGVVKRHLIPTGPVPGVRIDDQSRGHLHLLEIGEEMLRLSVGNA